MQRPVTGPNFRNAPTTCISTDGRRHSSWVRHTGQEEEVAVVEAPNYRDLDTGNVVVAAVESPYFPH